MTKDDSYFFARALTTFTGIVFFTQIILNIIGLTSIKEGYEWVILACGTAFVASLIYAGVLIFINAKNRRLK